MYLLIEVNKTMEITINDHRKIFAIQKEFSDLFPFLKLEFSAKPNTSGGASPKEILVSPSKSIGECRTVHTNGILTITPHMSVSDVEEIFSDNLGLSVRVFRKSGSMWMEITTKMFTLENLNSALVESNSI